MTAETETYQTNQNGTITEPGKFEGEPSWLPHYYDMTLDSMSSETVYDGETPVDVFELSEEDHVRMGVHSEEEHKKPSHLIVWQSDQGFINSALFYSEFEFTEWVTSVEAAEEDITCDQCNAMMIQRVYCHETGCPNAKKIKVEGEWVSPESEEYDEEEYIEYEEETEED